MANGRRAGSCCSCSFSLPIVHEPVVLVRPVGRPCVNRIMPSGAVTLKNCRQCLRLCRVKRALPEPGATDVARRTVKESENVERWKPVYSPTHCAYSGTRRARTWTCQCGEADACGSQTSTRLPCCRAGSARPFARRTLAGEITIVGGIRESLRRNSNIASSRVKLPFGSLQYSSPGKASSSMRRLMSSALLNRNSSAYCCGGNIVPAPGSACDPVPAKLIGVRPLAHPVPRR